MLDLRERPDTVPAAQGDGADDDPWVPRFSAAERFAHWWIAGAFAFAFLTGVTMGDPTGVRLWLHVAAAASAVLGLVGAVVLGDVRSLVRAAVELFRFDRRDVERVRHPRAGGPARGWGKFNTGQKLLAWAITGTVIAVVVTGALSAAAGGSGLHPAALTVLGVLLGAHVFMAVVNPATRPALPGMVFGRVRRSWAARHHREWLDHVEPR